MNILISFVIYMTGMTCCILLPTKWFRNKGAHFALVFIWPLVVPFLPFIGIVHLVDNILEKRYNKRK